MKIYEEKSIEYFNFSSGARYITDVLTSEEFERIENILLDAYPDGISNSELDDLFDYESDTIAQWLGYEDTEDLIRQHE